MSVNKKYISEDKLDYYLKNSPTACLILNKQRKIKEVSKALKDLIGFEEEELIKFSFKDIISKKDKEKVNHVLSDFEKSGSTNSKITLLKKNKSEVTVNLNGFELSDAHYMITFSKIIKDESDKKFKLKTNRIILNKASEISRIGTWELNLDTFEGSWSDVTAEIHEVTKGYFPNMEKGIKFYKEGETQTKISEVVEAAIEQGIPYDVELEIITAKNNLRWVRTIGIPEVKNGKTVKLYGIFQDLTEQKTREAENNKLRELYKDLYDNAPAMYISLDPSQKIIECNSTVLKILGYSKEELIGMPMHQLLTPESIEKLNIDFPILKNKGKLINVERQLIAKKGDLIDTLLSVTLDYDANGNPLKTRGVYSNITKRKSIQLKLAQSEEKFRTLFEMTNDAIITISKGEILSCNQAALNLFQFKTKTALLDRPPIKASPKLQPDGSKSKDSAKKIIAKAYEKGSNFFEWTFYKADETIFLAEVLLSPMILEGKDVFQAIIRDISKRKQLENELNESRQELESRVIERTTELVKVNQTLKKEILEREKIEVVLKETSQKWDSLVNNTKAMISIINHDGIIEFMGNLTEKVKQAGLSSKQMIGTPIYDYHLEEDHSRIKKTIDKVKKDGSTLNLQVNGAMSESVYDCTITPWYKQDQIAGTIWIYNDVTEKLKLEQNIIASAQRYRDFINHSKEGIWRIEFNKKLSIKTPINELSRIILKAPITESNDAMAKMYGYNSSENILGQNLLDLLGSKTNEDKKVAIERSEFFINNNFNVENKISTEKDKNGNIIYISNSTTGDVEDGFLIRLWGVKKNITRQVFAEDALKKSESNLAEAQRIARIGDWRWDSIKNKLFWSDETYRLFGYQPQEIEIDFDIYMEHVHPDNRTGVKAIIYQALENQQDYSYQFKSKTNTGKIKMIEVQGEIIVNDEGKTIGTRGTYQDITEKKASEMALQKAHYELEKRIEERTKDLKNANTDLKKATLEAKDSLKAKEEFLSTMSHEIRTPLNAIIGTVNLLHLLNPKPDQLENLNLLKLSSDNLLTLVNDILDFNKMEAGKVVLESIDFNLKDIFLDVKKSMLNKANEAGLDLLLDYSKDLPEVFVGDSFRISQVIINLVSNAIKFTKEGYVKLEVIEIKNENEHYTIRIQVSDTGIGIAQDKLSAIFEDFQQASDYVSRKYGGTGLGLSISKQLVELMGGEIFVESETGHGSMFYFDLKLLLGNDGDFFNDTDEKTSTNMIENDLHILVAEDNEGNRIIIQQFLLLWGIESDFAHNGKEAVDMISSKKYDMILMDIQMPEMDGLEATKTIRNMPDAYFKNIPIIALTAFVTTDVINKTKEAGMNNHVSKPFKVEDLFEKITQHSSSSLNKSSVSEKDQAVSLDLEAEFPYLFEIFEGSQELITTTVETIIETIPKELIQLSNHYHAGKLAMCADVFHSIKPNIESIGLKKLAKQCEVLEEAASTENKELLDQNMDVFQLSLKQKISEIEKNLSSM